MDRIGNRRSLFNQVKGHPYDYLLSSNIIHTTSLHGFELEDKNFPRETKKSLSEIYAPQKLLYSKRSKTKLRSYRRKKKSYLLPKKKVPNNRGAAPRNLLYHWVPQTSNNTRTLNQGSGDIKENTLGSKALHREKAKICDSPQQINYDCETLVEKFSKIDSISSDTMEQNPEDEVATDSKVEENESPSPQNEIIENEIEAKGPSVSDQGPLKDEAGKEELGQVEQSKEKLKVSSGCFPPVFELICNNMPAIRKGPSVTSDEIFQRASILAEIEETHKIFCETSANIEELKKQIEEYEGIDLTPEEEESFKEKEIQLNKNLSTMELIIQKLAQFRGITGDASEKDIRADTGILDKKYLKPPEKLDICKPPESERLIPKITCDDICRDDAVMSGRKVKTSSLFTISDSLKHQGSISDRSSMLSRMNELPKLIMCQTGENLPKIVVCDKNKKLNIEGAGKGWPYPNIADTMDPRNEVVISLTERLKQSCILQDQLVDENTKLEKFSYQLQEESIEKDQAYETMKCKYNQLQRQVKSLSQENSQLQKRLCQKDQQSGKGNQDFERSLKEKILPCIDKKMKSIERDLKCVQMQRKEADKERNTIRESTMNFRSRPTTCPPPPITPDKNNEKILQLTEQYSRVKEDYKIKVTEVAALQVENENLLADIEEKKKNLQCAENTIKELQEKLDSDDKGNGSKGQSCQLMILELQLKETKNELEELNAKYQESSYQEEYYRGKYLLAQQQIEEQRRQIDMMDADNNRITMQVEEEMQRVKCQFQEKLDELKALPELLRNTQCRLQEALQKQKQTEEKACEIKQELETTKFRLEEANQKLESFWAQHEEIISQHETLKAKVEAWEKKCKELQDDNNRMTQDMRKAEECATKCRRCAEEKAMEIVQLNNQLECVREESARQVAKTKERCEAVRRTYQAQVEELERQLALCRASVHAAQTERDETRKRMQCHINNLSNSFEQAQSRIRYLQTHVNQAKNSFSNLMDSDSGGCADMMDSCDCD